MILDSLYAIFERIFNFVFFRRIRSLYNLLTLFFIFLGFAVANADIPPFGFFMLAILMQMQRKKVHYILNKYHNYFIFGGPHGNRIGYADERELIKAVKYYPVLFTFVAGGLAIFAALLVNGSNPGWVAKTFSWAIFVLVVLFLCSLSHIAFSEAFRYANASGAGFTEEETYQGWVSWRWIFLTLFLIFAPFVLDAMDINYNYIDIAETKLWFATTVFDIAAYSQVFFDKFI